MKVLLSSPEGDPNSSAIWSGTPRRLRDELDQRGLLGGTHDASYLPARLHRLCAWLTRKLFGIDLAYAYSPPTRFLRALRLHKRIGFKPARVLHTGTLGIPLLWRNRRQRHYLFIDTTWHLAAQYSPDLARFGPRLRRWCEALDRRSYRQMRHIFPIGAHVRDDLIEHYGIPAERVTAVGTGRGRLEPYRGPKDYRNGHILFVAKQRAEEKGVDLLVSAFAIAVGRNPALKLLLIGREDFARYERDVRNVTARAFVSDEELQQAFNGAALFAMPARYEPWGLVYLEALICRTPIVALDRNAGREFCDNGRSGFLLGKEEPEALADLLLAAFEQPDRLAAMGEHGQRIAQERYRWDRTMDQIIHAMDREEHD